jgi:hypothetical protein
MEMDALPPWPCLRCAARRDESLRLAVSRTQLHLHLNAGAFDQRAPKLSPTAHRSITCRAYSYGGGARLHPHPVRS